MIVEPIEDGEPDANERVRAPAGALHSRSAIPHSVLKMMMLAMWRVQLENPYRPICADPML